MVRAHFKPDENLNYVYNGFNHSRTDHKWVTNNFPCTSFGPGYIVIDFPDVENYEDFPNEITDPNERGKPRSIEWIDSLNLDWMYAEEYISSIEDPFGEISYLSGYRDAQNGERRKVWDGEYQTGWLDGKGDEELNEISLDIN